MLRLQIDEALPWVDSRERLRSPYEQFSLLTPDARTWCESVRSGEITVWNVGVLMDDWDPPESSKRQLLGDPDSNSESFGYALGYERADELREELVPLWTNFLTWLLGGEAARMFLSDTLWYEGKGWVKLQPAIKNGLFSLGKLVPEPVGANGVGTVRGGDEELHTLLQYWWPSGLGKLGGVVLRDDADGVWDRRIACSGQINALDLPRVRHYFQTVKSFDNAGLQILTVGQPWTEIQSQLAKRGWTDGVPVDLLLR